MDSDHSNTVPKFQIHDHNPLMDDAILAVKDVKPDMHEDFRTYQ